MQKLLSFFLMIALVASAKAQTISINGRVKNYLQQSISEATVSLLHAADSSWLQSVITSADGSFIFSQIKSEAYLLDISAIGYQHAFQAIGNGLTGIEIILQKNETTLQEIVVKSKAPTIQTSLGKMTVNFEAATISQGNNVLDLLRRAPGVTVDGNGNISMNGKGVLVMMNDRQTYLSGEDLINYLKNLSAEEVAQLELINQPGAKYDAEGVAGIINIQTRKNKKAGTNGSISASYGQGVYANTHENANLNYKTDRLTLFANAGYLHATGFLNQTTKTNTATTSSFQNIFRKETFEDYDLNGGGEYAVNDKTVVGGSFQGVYHPNKEKGDTKTNLDDYAAASTIFNSSENNRGFIRRRFRGNLFATYKPSKNQTFTAEGNYLWWNQKEGQHLISRNYDEQGKELANGLALNISFPLAINVYVAKADYEGSFKSDFKIESGIKSSFLNNETDALYSIFQNNAWIQDTTRTNNYRYRENINAAYLSLSKKLSKKWQAQLGLRAEQTNIHGIQQVHNQQFDRSFISLFPTAFVSYKLNDAHSFEINAGRRIERPSYKDLNPFVFYLSQYTLSSGNPNLLPEYRYAFALKHNFKNKLFTELSYARVSDIINPIISFDSAYNAVHTLLVNLSNKHNAHFSATYNQEVTNWWTLTAAYNFYFNRYQDSNNQLLSKSIGQSISLTNQFNYKSWSLFTFYLFNTGDLQSLTERNGPNQWMNGTIAKKIWKDTATISLELNDPFGIYSYTPVNNWNGVRTESTMQFATQNVSLGFRYFFGKKMELQRHESVVEESRRM